MDCSIFPNRISPGGEQIASFHLVLVGFVKQLRLLQLFVRTQATMKNSFMQEPIRLLSFSSLFIQHAAS